MIVKQTDAPVVLGIDIGIHGGVALISPALVEARITPTFAAGRGGKRLYDRRAMVELLEQFTISLAVIEAVGAMHKQGVVSTFTFGEGYGLWQGMLDALRIPYLAVKPQEWKKVVLAGTAKDKSAAIAFASRRFPDVNLRATPRCKTAHDGMADALCLAEYARRLLIAGGDNEAF